MKPRPGQTGTNRQPRLVLRAGTACRGGPGGPGRLCPRGPQPLGAHRPGQWRWRQQGCDPGLTETKDRGCRAQARGGPWHSWGVRGQGGPCRGEARWEGHAGSGGECEWPEHPSSSEDASRKPADAPGWASQPCAPRSHRFTGCSPARQGPCRTGVRQAQSRSEGERGAGGAGCPSPQPPGLAGPGH